MKAQVVAAMLTAVLAAAGGDPAVRDPGTVDGGGQQAAAGDADATAQVLSRLSSDAIAAQQIGHLAADKNMQAAYALLGDQMALVNSQIGQTLGRVANENGMQVAQVMDGEARQRFEQMKKLNKESFAQELVAFVHDTYPRLLSGIDTLSRQVPNSQAVAALTNDAAPRLHEQMQTAQQLAQGESDQQNAQSPNRGPIERKDDPRAIPESPR